MFAAKYIIAMRALILLIFIFLFNVADATPCCRLRHNGFLGIWFRDVFWSPPSGLCSDPCISCTGPGNNRCTANNAGINLEPYGYDETDLKALDLAWEYVDQQVETRVYEGSHLIVIKLEEEEMDRIYSVSWTLGPKGEGIDTFNRIK